MQSAFGEWAPDRPSTGKGGLRTAKNVIPREQSYAPLKALVESSDVTTARPLGAISIRDKAGSVHTYTGDSTKLYELSSSLTWTDRSKVGGYGPATTTTRWNFCQYGDRIVATNLLDAIQYIDASTGTAFANLAGSPPKAQFVTAFQQFLILAATETSKFTLRWSEIGNSEGWSTSLNQGGEEEFADGGEITGLASTDALYIFQEFCIRRATYVGGDIVFQFDVVERLRGCIAPGSIVQVGRMIFYQAQDGFFMFDGEQSQPIGGERVNRFFMDDLDRANAQRITGAGDVLNSIVAWSYPSTDAVDGAPDTLLIYNWVVNRWSYAKAAVEALFTYLSAGYSLEALDAIFGDLDSVPVSLDDLSLAGGALSLGAMTPTKALATFSGDNTEATLVTDDIPVGDDLVGLVRACRPVVDASSAYVKMGKRFRLTDAVSWTSEAGLSSATGRCPLRATGRYMRVSLRIPAAATWTKAEGFELDVEIEGAR